MTAFRTAPRALLVAALLSAGAVEGGSVVTAPVPLTQLAQQWQDLSPRERDEAMRNYQRFQKLPPGQRETVEKNYNRWQQLPPEEKERIRGNYREYREMSPEERRDFQRRYQEWRGKQR